MIFSMTKKSGSHRYIKNINKIKAKASDKCSYYSSNSSRSDSDYDFPFLVKMNDKS